MYTSRSRLSAFAAALLIIAAACGGDSGPAGNGPTPVAAVQLSRTQHALLVGETVQLGATPLDRSGAPLNGRAVSWRSENSAVATVSAQGLVTAQGAGTATIVAASGGTEGRAAITVTAAPPAAVATVELNATDVTTTVGQTTQLTATMKNALGATLPNRVVTWASANDAVATVNPAGVVTAVGVGTARVTATSEGKEAHAQITVGAAPAGAVANVTLNAIQIALEEGATYQIVATPRDAQGQPIAGLGMTWTTNTDNVARVDALGRVTGISSGNAIVKVRVHGKEAEATVQVTSNSASDLVYAVQDGGSSELYRLDFRQPNPAPARILPAGQTAWTPRTSPDGTQLAFAATIDGQPGIYVVRRDGTGRRWIAGWTNGIPSEPTWSPDGLQIAYTATKSSGESDIWVVNATDGSNPVNITGDVAGVNQYMPAWSPALGDGTSRIAFVQPVGGKWSLWTMRPDGTDKQRLTTGDSDILPAWSPDGATIAFQRSTASIFGDIWLVNAAGGNERALMPFYALPGPQWAPAWSPDGKLIAFTSSHETYGSGTPIQQVYTVWTDGSKLARRTGPDGLGKANPVWMKR